MPATTSRKLKAELKRGAMQNDLRVARSYLIDAARRADELGEREVHHPVLTALTAVDDAREAANG